MNRSISITHDFAAWANKLGYDPNVVFPESITQYVAGYMLSPVAMVEGVTVVAHTYTTSTIDGILDYIKCLSTQLNVYVYNIVFEPVDIPTSYTIRLATLNKDING